VSSILIFTFSLTFFQQYPLPLCTFEKIQLWGKVEQFPDTQAGLWHDLNISADDGQLHYDLIIKGN
jgi:hypothetical protein